MAGAGAGPRNLHSRVVRILKLALPLLALAILSTLFLVSHGVKPEDAIPYADVDIASRLAQPRITEPSFAGMTADGAALTLRAAEVRAAAPGGGGPGAEQMRGLLETPDGATLRLQAGRGQLVKARREIELGGGVEIVSSTGLTVATPGVVIALDRTDVRSTGEVRATGPFGLLRADHLRLRAEKGVERDYVLLFSGNLRVIYQPR